MKSFSCKEFGMNCNYIAHGKTEDEVLNKAMEHGKKVHGMKTADFTSDKIKKIRSLIHLEKPQVHT